METLRKIEIIQIGDNEYRLSGAFNYNAINYKYVIVDGEKYQKSFYKTELVDFDEIWNKKTRVLFCGVDNDIPLTDTIRYSEFDMFKTGFMKIFDAAEITLWTPSGYSTDLINYLDGVESTSYYASLLQSLDYVGAFHKIKGTLWCGKKYDYFDKDRFDIIIDHYGFNNNIGFSLSFKDLIQYDLLKLTEHLHYYRPQYTFGHSPLINNIIKDYYQKTGSITDSDRVNILSNFINTMVV